MLNVICLNVGPKYGPTYVNNLHNMIMRNLTVPHNFICFTDNPSNLNPNIQVQILPNLPIHSWWWKLYLFKEDLFQTGDINLFFDLDMVIIKNINHYIDYLPGEFVGLRDVGRAIRPNIIKLGSAVLRWNAREYSDIWTSFDIQLMNKFHGDQDWIWHLYQHKLKFFPDEWIRSYKWEIRTRYELIGSGPITKFKDIRDPIIPLETSTLAFHGYPNPHQVKDKIIVDNWC